MIGVSNGQLILPTSPERTRATDAASMPKERSERGVGYRAFQEYRQKCYTSAAAKITENLGVSDRLLQIPPSTIYNKGILSPICMLPRDLTMTHPVWSVSVSQLTSSPN